MLGFEAGVAGALGARPALARALASTSSTVTILGSSNRPQAKPGSQHKSRKVAIHEAEAAVSEYSCGLIDFLSHPDVFWGYQSFTGIWVGFTGFWVLFTLFSRCSHGHALVVVLEETKDKK